MAYLLTAAITIIYLILVWFTATFLHLQGFNLWFLRIALAVIGLIAAGIFVWFYRRRKAAQEDSGEFEAVVGETAELDLVVREAMRRLKKSTLGRGATLGNLPVIFLLGESGSTKTTTVVHSALDPELLAGQVYQDNNILPTRVANIWYTRQAVFVDPAGGLMAQPSLWKRLLRLVQPGRLTSTFGKGQQAARAAIVCYDCENFLKPGASESSLSAARKLAVRLQEISHLLGISFAVYVLFTKIDRIASFQEFVARMNKDEASEVLGATLPVRSFSTGVYAEEEGRRLTKAFDELFYSLSERRLDLLSREREADKLPGIYEFPRELRKFRTLLVQFLVDLARPSQLSVNPFLRGFYFSGVRPVIIDDMVAAPQQEAPVAEPLDAGATRIFSGGMGALASAPVPARVAGARKVPQWVFLTQLFNDVIVKDRVALAASGFSSRINLLRRILLGAVALASVVCMIGFVISFVGNRSLEHDVQAAAADLRTVQASRDPSLADLQKLDHLRRDLVSLGNYNKDGAPLSLRWGLYSGNEIYPGAKKVYFERFHQLLLSDTQAKLLNDLRTLPDKPGPNDSYENAYKKLKAYLITTSNHEKSTAELSPVLLGEWKAGRNNVDADRENLARQQFDYYSTELTGENPFSSVNDSGAIARARNYLSQSAGIDRFYLPLLSKVPAKEAGFTDEFPDAAGVVTSRRVRGAFTRDGFQFMQQAIQNPSLYMAGEEWVLGKQAASELDAATLQEKIRQRYYQDFANEWHAVLHDSNVVPYKDFADAQQKLDKLAGLTSPLLELFYFVAHNTDVGVAEVTAPFVPVQAIEPPGPADKLPDQYILASNKDYIVALTKMQTDVAPLVSSPGDKAAAGQLSNSTGAAKVTVTTVMGTRIDQRFHNEVEVRRLLEEPIVDAEELIGSVDKNAINAAAQGFCSQFSGITGKYPFNPNSTQDLPIDQLNAIFAPKTGALWTFYDTAKLSQYLTKDGSRYVANSSGSVKLSPAFVVFFNRVAGLSDALYPAGSTTPHFAYTLRQTASNAPDGLTLKIGSDSLTGIGLPKTFTWTGAPEDAQVTAKGGAILGSSYSGPWAVFKLLGDARSQISGTSTNLEWRMESNGKPIMLNGQPETYDYQLTVAGSNPFHAAELAGLQCVSQVAH
jgi:type VI secretion system protein ImpL